MVEQVVPGSPWHTTVEQISMLQFVEEATVEQVDLPLRRLQPVENPCQSRFQARAAAHGEGTTQEQVTKQELLPVGDPCLSSLFLMDGPCGKDPYLEQFLKSCFLQEAHAGSVQEGWHPMGGIPGWSRGRE